MVRNITWAYKLSKFLISSFFFESLPNIDGISFLRAAIIYAWTYQNKISCFHICWYDKPGFSYVRLWMNKEALNTFARRALLIKSFSFRRAAFLGSDCRSAKRSFNVKFKNVRLTQKIENNWNSFFQYFF